MRLLRSRRRRPVGSWRAPGRVNLIGEHTDYNDGLVLPYALPQGITVTGCRRDDDVLEMHSLGRTERVDLAALVPGAVTGWSAYVAGVAACLRDAGHPVGGAALRFTSDLPQGAGVSSSAALECATAVALAGLYELDAGGEELARIAQRAEHEYAGVPCGILDQSAALLCRADHALLLDCRSGAATHVPLRLGDHRVLVVDTRAGHRLGDGEYASRRSCCEEAARALGVGSLRDVVDPEAAGSLKDPVMRRRVRHVVEENRRVEAAVGLLSRGEIAELGPLLTASHASLRDNYEVSWPQADVAVDAALAAQACGARMFGGGFGGSVLVLAHRDALADVRASVDTAFSRRGWMAPSYLETTAASGAGPV
ncbi:galactokinase [Actinomadura sp. NTSP31]|uniref:galactokinase n=1 Tax=Actinomadura sp. NTSP31 TaxID=1735447 RepID=UPI0035C1FB8E